ncbi:UDP-N-acetylmuramoyl-L-alanyl-D-glutamate--2,6-diaminopimelate ligase [Bacillus luteolus]|uniref:UDP-N-acetylmuramoyl-L-alanyl-D-glutamate--2,6-diaminopimelate ligase n=1 Tax=Litchfieldia luteola TaxID=682179 RepID=A0ABR9QJZ7_9BACI|nr:UDP-N-acetylmuramoyl-L-alanyl-D-glutamate--2,6-diaminopimelate ligase [Cytobacillus luteolus]MBE4908824.1 UDP-N-acetylmuramoyl-L-alanyl-D-glutamate--2,6-diaminopimelate ligase [Cytobacillus luteolus]MBP1941682.1 UDP-N-acetylmuramoyl-L-alanyl-D-glutamate--2,6-diaminopimelate ligase [Cytobacillus luteolus]
MDLNTLISHLHTHTIDGINNNPSITSIEMDSRQVTTGSLFICIKGDHFDGHEFAEQAVEKGAVAILSQVELNIPVPVVIVSDTRRAMAILADAFYNQPTQKLHLIGVTGTNGKTSTTHIIEKVMRDHGLRTGMIGTMYMKIGEKVYETKNTTPESLTLQKTFATMVSEKVDTAVMEVSSHALDIGRVHGCEFNIAVFTNLTQDHLDFHKSMDDYRRAKGLLFSGLGNSFNHRKPKFAILNSDDISSREYQKSTAATVITYGIDNNSDIMAKDISMTSSGTAFTLVTPFGLKTVKTKLVGKFSVYNILASVATCLYSGVPLETIIKSVEDLEGIPGRFELVHEGQGYTVIVDYAHTPDSLENVLTTVKQFANGKVTVVVGCGGDRDKTKRPLMASIATKYADCSIFTSDNPRSEDPQQILLEMEAGAEGNFKTIVDREEAIKFAVNDARNEDVIVIAGKGHETYQIIGDNTLDFDDRLVASKAIKERRN